MKSDWLVFGASVLLLGLLWWSQPQFICYYTAPLASSNAQRISWMERVIYAAALANQHKSSALAPPRIRPKKNPEAALASGSSI